MRYIDTTVNSVIVVRQGSSSNSSIVFESEHEAIMDFARRALVLDLLQVLDERGNAFTNNPTLVGTFKGVYERIISEAVAAALTPP